MTPISISVARVNFAETIHVVAQTQEPVVLTRRGKPLVAVVPVQSLRRAQLLDVLANGAQCGVSEARTSLADVVNRVRYRCEPVVLKNFGKLLAAMVPLEHLATLGYEDSPCVDTP